MSKKSPPTKNIEPLTLTKEEEAQLKPHAEKWAKLALRTETQTPQEREELTTAMIQFYEGLGLPQLTPDWVIHVRSPIEGRFVAGLLAAGWHMHLEVEPKKWTMERLLQLREFCANLPLLKEPDYSRWHVRPYDPKAISAKSGLGDWGLECVRVAHKMWHGGNMSVSPEAFLSFFKDIVKVDERYGVDFSKWTPWRETVVRGGGRFLHERFAVISDFPELLTYDDRDRPHGDSAPHARFRDGSALYYIHGVQIPAWLIEQPEKITAKAILSEANAEVRRVMIDRMTPAKFIESAKAKIVDQDKDGLGKPRRLLRVELPDDEPLVMIEVTNSTPEPDGTYRLYHLRVDPNAYNGRAGKECLAAIASTWREKKAGTPLMFKTPEEYVLAVET